MRKIKPNIKRLFLQLSMQMICVFCYN